MMRKTFADTVRGRSSSRKRGGGQDRNDDSNHKDSSNHSNGGGDARQAQQPHPPPPPSVMSLTSKNYRLAKELSDLRVRHREECKKQTRLSMENMNLSSKYRDALQQVAVLKKEVAYYQRRAEALAKAGGATAKSPNLALALATNSGSNHNNNTPISLQGISSTSDHASPAVHVANKSMSMSSTSPLLTTTAGTTAATINNLVTPRKQASVLAEVVAEMNRMDQILADHAKKSSNSNNGVVDDPPLLLPPPSDEAALRTDSPHATTPALTSTTPESTTPTSSSSSSPSLSNYPSPPLAQKRNISVIGSTTSLIRSDDFEMELVELEHETSSLQLSPLEVNTSNGRDEYLINGDKETKEDDWNTGRSTEQQHRPSPPSGLHQKVSPNNKKSSLLTSSLLSSSPPRETTSFFPHTASPKFRFNEEYPGDITAAAVRTSKKMTPQRQAIVEGSEDAKDDEEAPGPSQPTLSNVNAPSRMPESVSSIDAFEASFFTDFPDSFSPKSDAARRKSLLREEIYNPFSQSPVTRYDWRGTHYSPIHSTTDMAQPVLESKSTTPLSSDPPGHDRTTSPANPKPPLRKSPVTVESIRSGLIPSFNHSLSKVAPFSEDSLISSSNSSVSTSTSSRSPLASPGAILFQTPPPPVTPASASPPSESPPKVSSYRFATPPPATVSDASQSNVGGSTTTAGSVQPKRPEKTGHEAARAKREKVLQPRSTSAHPKFVPAASSPSLSQPQLTPPTSSKAIVTVAAAAAPHTKSAEPKRIKAMLDPNSREAIILSARERLSASTSALSVVSIVNSPYSTPPSASSSHRSASFSENSINRPNTTTATTSTSTSANSTMLWGESVYDDDGDIPLRSSLTKNMEGRLRVESVATHGSMSLSQHPSQLPPKRTLWRENTCTTTTTNGVDDQEDLQKRQSFNGGDDDSENGPSNSPRLSRRRVYPTDDLGASSSLSTVMQPPSQQMSSSQVQQQLSRRSEAVLR